MLMAGSVIELTATSQGRLHGALYSVEMDTELLTTAGERIAFARDRSGKTLEQLGAEIGCSHAALSNWETGKTDASQIKVGLLQAFADRTGFELRWLLTGEGPQVSRYVRTIEMERVSVAIQAMERVAPMQIETVVRMVEAAAEAINHNEKR